MSVGPDADATLAQSRRFDQMCIAFPAHGADGPRPLFDEARWFMRAGSVPQATQEVVFVAPEEPFAERKEFGRFKVLAQVRNIDDVSILSFAKRYNGKPALIRKTGMLYRCGPSGTYLNMDINVHAFGYMARWVCSPSSGTSRTLF